MCGIAGVAGALVQGSAEALDHRISAGLAALRHRGPDGEGRWADAGLGVALGHRRLAIIDLSTHAAQPMATEDGRHAVSFNGEIYNYRELRARLEQRGERFTTSSDTEVLLLACRAWGPVETARRARGMFAFAYVDGPRRRMWLVRDRFGEKPLYWTHHEGSVVFASELKALVAVTGHRPALDHAALAGFLARSAVPQPATIYEDVRQVPAGAALCVELGERIGAEDIGLQVHWDAVGEAVRARMEPFRGSLDDAVAAVHERLRESVHRSTVSDRPVGAFLSGGIDSTVVTALMQEVSDQPVRTFTIGFDDPDVDESSYAAAVASALGTKQTTVSLSAQDVLDVVPQLPTMYDEPFADPSQLPTHLVARVAQADVTVALSGDAGDELFGGYNRHITSQRLYGPLTRVPRGVRGAAGRAALGLSPAAWDAVGRAGLRRGPTGGLGPRVHKLGAIAGFTDARDLYDKLTSVTPRRYVLGGVPPQPPRLPSLGTPAESFMLADAIGYLTDDILVKVDRAAMAVSLETRIPMLDPSVYRLAWSLPLEHKLAGGVGKLVLRRLLGTVLPAELVDRPKMGFGPPLGDWLRGPLRAWADDLLTPATLRRQGLLDADAVRATWERHRSGRRDHTNELWNLLVFQGWLTQWRGA
ncbi:asparagine synthase (glutamine-hydrolyzing) [Blastococcus sp. TF02A-30]|uniref:asparagine synthase (glutamine-hydrolyzing) n=1 Tax=Blastococcus sp. TF02A-30 TaxID=2250580 RepID=UPI00131487D5|nr:asparagine synthase (glutamine-hydrolyzing) [Blastococcus sp. TF02A-30]